MDRTADERQLRTGLAIEIVAAILIATQDLGRDPQPLTFTVILNFISFSPRIPAS
jgi:hypothetical protein